MKARRALCRCEEGEIEAFDFTLVFEDDKEAKASSINIRCGPRFTGNGRPDQVRWKRLAFQAPLFDWFAKDPACKVNGGEVSTWLRYHEYLEVLYIMRCLRYLALKTTQPSCHGH